jgi:hypothetical protein
MSGPGSKAEKLKAKQWGFSSEKTELFAHEPGIRPTGPAPINASDLTTPHRWL